MKKAIINNKNITICNIYYSNKYEIDTNELESLTNQLSQPFLIIGDFNSHNSLWGSYKTDKRGKTIKELILNNNLILLNKLSPTNFNVATGYTSAIDLSLCSSTFATKVEWNALDYLYGSDHYPIIITIDETNPPITIFTILFRN